MIRTAGAMLGLVGMMMAGMALAEEKAAPADAGQPPAAQSGDQGQKAQAAEQKAEKLEEKAVEGGNPPAAEKITKPEAEAVDPAGQKPLDDPLTCLARTIYWESKGEDRASMEAIANVVMNRVGKEGFPDSICGVVKEGQEKKACQFSWWCDGKPDDVEEPEPYATAKEVARLALNKQLKDRTDGGLYFYRKGSAVPDWASKYKKTATVGDHVFYKPKDGDAK